MVALALLLQVRLFLTFFIILGAIVPMSFVPDPIYGLAVGVVVGGFAQLALLSGDLVAGKIMIKPVWKPADADLPEAWRASCFLNSLV